MLPMTDGHGPVRLLVAANKALAGGDHRFEYARRSAACEVGFILPAGAPAPGPVYRLDVGEGLSWRDVGAMWGLFRILRAQRRQRDAVHFFSTKLAAFGPIAARLSGLTAIVTVTGLGRAFSAADRPGIRRAAARGGYLLCFAVTTTLCSAVLFQNADNLRSFSRWFPWARRKFSLVGGGIALSEPPPDDDDTGPVNVLCVSRLLPSKGVTDFLWVARELAGESFRFRLAGAPSAGAHPLVASVRAADERGWIEYLGELGPTDLDDAYTRADVLVLPSYGEGLPRVLLEAAQWSLYPIAYDVPGSREVVAPPGGALVPACDRAALAAAVRATEDATVRRRGALAFRRHVCDHYEIDAYVHRVDSAILGACRRG
jgi:glycosyltransferase involved in cell wall biosynthesis